MAMVSVFKRRNLAQDKAEERPVPHLEGFHHSIDSLRIRRGRLYGFGWMLHQTRMIDSVCLVLHGETHTRTLRVIYKCDRPDVEKDFPYPSAAHSGFWLSCKLRPGESLKMSLNVTFEDGGHHTVPLPSPSREESPQYSIRKNKIQEALWYMLRGELKTLYLKLFGFLKRKILMPKMAAGLSDFIAQGAPFNGESVLFIVDHNMGGGANLYREEYSGQQAGKRRVLLLYYDLPNLEYRLRWENTPGAAELTIDPVETLLQLPTLISIGEIFLNNLVSYDDPIALLKLLLELKKRTAAELTLPLHDYFSICPSYTLLDAEGVYCNVPDLTVCRKCLLRSEGEFRMLVDHDNIDTWRAAWNQAMLEANSVICFSQTSAEILRRAYPDVKESSVVVHPHKVDYLEDYKPRLSMGDMLHIGVVGTIGEHKGAGIVEAMVKIIETRSLPIRITVIGTLSNAPTSPVLRVTGLYKRTELPFLLEKYGINICLVPSVWPETFCYVVQELIQFDVPTAVFALGAQAERIATYRQGVLIPKVDAEVALETLMEFYAQNQTQNSFIM